MTNSVVPVLAEYPILTLFVVVALGYFLGRVSFFGFRLGVAGVLFAGIAVGSLSPRLALPGVISTLGLVIFIYTIGIQSGPGFINPFSRSGSRDTAYALAVLALGAGVAVLLARTMRLSGPDIAGLFCGGLTNAPALAASQELLRQAGFARGLSAAAAQRAADQPVIGFGIAYPFGVVGVMLSFHIARKLWKVRLQRPPQAGEILVRDFVVKNPGIAGQKIAEIQRLHSDLGFVISRIQHDRQTSIALPESELHLGDIVVTVGDEESLARARQLFGEPSEERLELDRNELDYRRFFVSDAAVVGRRIRDLDLYSRLHAVITRVRRGDVDLVPGQDTCLEYGDFVRVLTYRSNFEQVAAYFGDSIRGTAEMNLGSVGLGMALGVILGMIPIPLPGTTVRLGLAGGPLLAALALGRLERTGPITWTMPASANLTLRQIGLILFQAGVGTRAGIDFIDTLRRTGLVMVIAGAVITLAVVWMALIAGYKLLKIPFDSVLGLAAAIHTEPASLNYAANAAGSEVPQTAYARIFPVTTVAKIVLAQFLATVS